MAPPSPRWWKDGTVYQVWPASYKDSNGDGFGDIPGVISTLDHLKDLGIDIIWLSPMYDSPQLDMGYDIRDYEAVWEKFGTMDDMDTLIKEVHDRGMHLILDLVVNHTSDEHKWFQESKKSKDNEYSDWYTWRDPKYVDGKRQEPNNWGAAFGGSAWEYVPDRDQYYLHLFLKEQPDLNWENPITRKGIYKSAIMFWLDKGIDGFRVDVVGCYSKNQDFPDAAITMPGDAYQPPFADVTDGPRMHEFLLEQRKEALDKYGDVVLVGELGVLNHDETLKYVSAERRELDMVFDFEMMSVGGAFSVKPHERWQWKLPEIKQAMIKVHTFLKPDGWATSVGESHDQPRCPSRFATDDPKYRAKAAKLMAIFLATLSGTLFVYQGQEIGMVNFPKDWVPEELRDPFSLNYWKEMEEKYPGDDKMLDAAKNAIQKIARDHARTPVQWSAEKHAGFSTAEPWMRVNDNYKEINVAAQQKDPSSVLTLWKKVLQLRKGEHRDVLVYGDFEVHDFDNLDTFTYVKGYEEEKKKVLVALNFTAEEQSFDVPPALRDKKLKLLVANLDDDDLGDKLSPWEARAYLAE